MACMKVREIPVPDSGISSDKSDGQEGLSQSALLLSVQDISAARDRVGSVLHPAMQKACERKGPTTWYVGSTTRPASSVMKHTEGLQRRPA